MSKVDWDKEWDNANIEKNKIKIKNKSIIKNVSSDADLKGNVGKKIGILKGDKPTQPGSKTDYLKQL